MVEIALSSPNDFAEWRDQARTLLAHAVPPDAVAWRFGAAPGDLFADGAGLSGRDLRSVSVPKAFIARAETAICHATPDRFALLYRLAWRLQSQKGLLSVASDPDCIALSRLEKAVTRDSHKMKAFVRFRSLGVVEGQERFAAWFEPSHFTLERTAPFFTRRFAGMHWAILTPYRSAFWDTERLRFGAGAARTDVPAEDAMEEAWLTYFASIFNPARLKIGAMTSEMPRKYWHNLPEAALIPDLIRSAQKREAEMIASAPTQPPSRHVRQAARGEPVVEPSEIGSLEMAKRAIARCTRCPLYEQATQPVFGEGPTDAPVMFVGEQPGDSEDLAGRPFVGPAGQLFDSVMAEVGIDRRRAYVTNAVRHFKFTPRGKRRLHQKPNGGEVQACKFWLEHEIALVKPRLIVALGATAAQSLTGGAAAVSKLRGAPIALDAHTQLFVTVHPSYLLRIPDAHKARSERAQFVNDLRMIKTYLENEMGVSVALDRARA